MNEKLRKIEQICQKYKIRVMYFFGSRGLELYKAVQEDSYAFSASQSDLDIGVLTHVSFSIENKVNLTFELENLFSNEKVDLFVLQEIDAFLAANIIRGERIYTEDDFFSDEYELFVLRRAGDLAEFERERMAMILQEA